MKELEAKAEEMARKSFEEEALRSSRTKGDGDHKGVYGRKRVKGKYGWSRKPTEEIYPLPDGVKKEDLLAYERRWYIDEEDGRRLFIESPLHPWGAHDGIFGDKVIRDALDTDIMSGYWNRNDIKQRFSREEVNDWMTYQGFANYDFLVTRVTEGPNPIIPRQEYETISFFNEFYRYPELSTLITNTVGLDGVIELGASCRHEIGTKISRPHDMCQIMCTLMGRGIGMALKQFGPADHGGGTRKQIEYAARALWGKTQNGFAYTPQSRYREDCVDDDLIERFKEDIEPIKTDEQRVTYRKLAANAELAAFLLHYDCRLSVGATGPYAREHGLEPGHVLVTFDNYTNEPLYHWDDVYEMEGTPWSVSMVYEIDTVKMGLQEWRFNEAGTVFSYPPNYQPYIVKAAAYTKETWDTPPKNMKHVPMEEFPALTAKLQRADRALFRKYAKMSHLEKTIDGGYTYYVEMIMPYLRQAGVMKEAVDTCHLWEYHPNVLAAYYNYYKGGFGAVIIPAVMGGKGYLPYPEGADMDLEFEYVRRGVSTLEKEWVDHWVGKEPLGGRDWGYG